MFGEELLRLSREAGLEFGPAPRSSGGAPAHRAGGRSGRRIFEDDAMAKKDATCADMMKQDSMKKDDAMMKKEEPMKK